MSEATTTERQQFRLDQIRAAAGTVRAWPLGIQVCFSPNMGVLSQKWVIFTNYSGQSGGVQMYLTRIARFTIPLLSTIALVLPIAANAQATATQITNDPNVAKDYRNSSDLPNEIAFRQFLALIQTGPDSAERIDLRTVARAVGIAPDEANSYESARPYAEMFQGILELAERDKASEKHEVLCTPNRAARSAAESFEALNLAEDIDDEVNNRYYQETMIRLSEEQRAHFQDFLEKVKLGTTYVRTNDQVAGMSRQVEVETYCAELRYKLEVMEGQK